MTETTQVQTLSGLGRWAEQTDLVICDLWGVLHDGIHLHHGAENAIKSARNHNIATIFLSNSPRPRDYVRDLLAFMGTDPSLLDRVVTSGGLARDEIRHQFAGAALYHLGPEEDHNTVEGLPVDLVTSPDEADVILATGLAATSPDAHAPLLRRAAEKGVPFLCANPDRVVHVGNRLLICAGTIADLYEDMGGTVHWFGKPMASSLLACLGEAGLDPREQDRDRVVMIGDSLQTDIAGAKAAGVRSLLVGGGIHRDHTLAVSGYLQTGTPIPVQIFHEHFGHGKPVPDALIEQLVW